MFAGFGTDEQFPRLRSFAISGTVDGALRSNLSSENTITVENSALSAPFAQSETVQAFVSGLKPRYEQEMKGPLACVAR